jgi:rhodanese-related sulfurtransferase
MEVRQTTPLEAYATLQQNREAVYLDVRTVEEFSAGHPAGACNVPIFVIDPSTGRPAPNRDFLRVVEQNIPHGTKLLVGCQSGMRSQRACELLIDAGYTDVSNVQGSYGGMQDASGRLVVEGWRDAGLPVETGDTPGASYADLAGKR